MDFYYSLLELVCLSTAMQTRHRRTIFLAMSPTATRQHLEILDQHKSLSPQHPNSDRWNVDLIAHIGGMKELYELILIGMLT